MHNDHVLAWMQHNYLMCHSLAVKASRGGYHHVAINRYADKIQWLARWRQEFDAQ